MVQYDLKLRREGTSNSRSRRLVMSSNEMDEVIGKKAMIERHPDQPGDVPKTFADISKAKLLLGYDPQTKLKDGLKKFYDWFVENKDLLM